MGFPVKSNGASDLTNEDQESGYIGSMFTEDKALAGQISSGPFLTLFITLFCKYKT